MIPEKANKQKSAMRESKIKEIKNKSSSKPKMRNPEVPNLANSLSFQNIKFFTHKNILQGTN